MLLIKIEQKKRKRKFCFKLKFGALARSIMTLWQTDTQHSNKNCDAKDLQHSEFVINMLNFVLPGLSIVVDEILLSQS
jgi:hypothetical protein